MKVFVFGLNAQIEDFQSISTTRLNELVGGNTGNLAFHYAIDKTIQINGPTVSWHSSDEVIKAGGTSMIIPCANQVGEHMDMAGLGNKFAGLSQHMIAIGLGAQSSLERTMPNVPKGTISWLRSMAERSPTSGPNISVRGTFTFEVLEYLGFGKNSIVLGCPSLFIGDESQIRARLLEKSQSRMDVISTVAGHYRWKQLHGIERALAKLAASTAGKYIAQSPLEMLQSHRGELDGLSQSAINELIEASCPGMTPGEFKKWLSAHGDVYFSVCSWMEHYRRVDAVIGPRIHGVMLALQVGTPAVCIVHDSRTQELCELMKVPHILAKDIIGGISREQVEAAVKEFNIDEFFDNRRALAKRYIDFLKWNNLEPSHHLEKQALP
jgi:hypothetical protein